MPASACLQPTVCLHPTAKALSFLAETPMCFFAGALQPSPQTHTAPPRGADLASEGKGNCRARPPKWGPTKQKSALPRSLNCDCKCQSLPRSLTTSGIKKMRLHASMRVGAQLVEAVPFHSQLVPTSGAMFAPSFSPLHFPTSRMNPQLVATSWELIPN